MKRVFITGASSGLGAALAAEYARQGALLGLVARRESALEDVVAGLDNPGRHRVYAVDVNDATALRQAADDFLAEAGGVDVVIANAGVSWGTVTEEQEDLEVFRQIFSTNVLAMVATFAPFIAPMKHQAERGGRDLRLVGIASVAGMRGLPGAGAYSASKAAVMRYCESLRVELRGSGIRVVTIAPGYIDTPMTQINDYPMPFLMPAAQFARRAVQAIDAGAAWRVIPWQMGFVAHLLKWMPNNLYDLLFARAPHKRRKADSEAVN